MIVIRKLLTHSGMKLSILIYCISLFDFVY